MLAAAGLIAAGTLLLATVVPAVLARAQWPLRAPSPALLLWQALGLAGGLLALEACALVALAPYGDDVPSALADVDSGGTWWSYGAAGLGLVILVRLVHVLLRSTLRTLRERRRHRVMLDLLASRNPLLADTLVVDHDAPVAYCLPGLRSRVVVSRGMLAALEEQELRAVIAHERAHLGQRHDLVILPFIALGATFPWLPAVRTAQEQVLLLVEVLADDRAARRHDARLLASALGKLGSTSAPRGGMGVTGPEAVVRVERLLSPPEPLSAGALLLVLTASAATFALPVIGPFLPAAMG